MQGRLTGNTAPLLISSNKTNTCCFKNPVYNIVQFGLRNRILTWCFFLTKTQVFMLDIEFLTMKKKKTFLRRTSIWFWNTVHCPSISQSCLCHLLDIFSHQAVSRHQGTTVIASNTNCYVVRACFFLHCRSEIDILHTDTCIWVDHYIAHQL